MRTEVARGSTGNLLGTRRITSWISAKVGSGVGESDADRYVYDPDGAGEAEGASEALSVGVADGDAETDGSVEAVTVGVGSGVGFSRSANDGPIWMSTMPNIAKAIPRLIKNDFLGSTPTS